MMWRVTMIVLGAAVFGLGLVGCVTVQPWQRETLAQPAMAEQIDPEADTFEAHIAGAREAALDPGAAGGGGCGCN